MPLNDLKYLFRLSLCLLLNRSNWYIHNIQFRAKKIFRQITKTIVFKSNHFLLQYLYWLKVDFMIQSYQPIQIKPHLSLKSKAPQRC